LARLVRKKTEAAPDIWQDVRRMGELAAEHKALHIKAYDVRELTLIADSFLICSASSEPQMKAILNAVRDGMKGFGSRLLNAEGEPSGGWAVLDFGGTIFHLFRVEARVFYDLDGLWGDAPEIDLQLE
jgi:ribosome-associated protein